jgi:hypothetical protein
MRIGGKLKLVETTLSAQITQGLHTGDIQGTDLEGSHSDMR